MQLTVAQVSLQGVEELGPIGLDAIVERLWGSDCLLLRCLSLLEDGTSRVDVAG